MANRRICLCGIAGKRPLSEAVEGYLRTVAVVRPKALSEAVADFAASRAPKAEAKDGKRPVLNPKYVENTASWLRELAAAFPGHNVSDLGKDHPNAYIAEHAKLSAKSRNDRRAVVKLFLKWCPALEQWLVPYRGMEGKLAAHWQTVNGYIQAFIALRKDLKIPSRRNGLRHGFVTHHFALHQNENLTAAQAGNSPAMIHTHYKGLAMKAEAEKWFAVKPQKTSGKMMALPAAPIP